MKDIGNSSNFTEEEELFLLRNKQGKIVNIMTIKCMADCLSNDHFSMSYITDAAATM